MTDNELRGIILKKYYERRRTQHIRLFSSDFSIPIDEKDILYVCDQLAEHGLIHWHSFKADGEGIVDGVGHISAFGVDVVENGGVGAPIKISFDQSTHVSVHSSSGVQIGDSNMQGDSINLNQLVEAINKSAAAPQEKSDAKAKLKAFLKHPLVTTIIGKLTPGIDGLLS